MTVYAKKGKSGFDANIVIARDALMPNETFAEYSKRQSLNLSTSLPEFNLDREQAGIVGDYPAYEMLFTWTSAQGPLKQRTLFIHVGGIRVATYAATAAAKDYRSMEKEFDQAFSTLEIEGGEPPNSGPQFLA